MLLLCLCVSCSRAAVGQAGAGGARACSARRWRGRAAVAGRRCASWHAWLRAGSRPATRLPQRAPPPPLCLPAVHTPACECAHARVPRARLPLFPKIEAQACASQGRLGVHTQAAMRLAAVCSLAAAPRTCPRPSLQRWFDPRAARAPRSCACSALTAACVHAGLSPMAGTRAEPVFRAAPRPPARGPPTPRTHAAHARSWQTDAHKRGHADRS